jgi:hypothetical protein
MEISRTRTGGDRRHPITPCRPDPHTSHAAAARAQTADRPGPQPIGDAVVNGGANRSQVPAADDRERAVGDALAALIRDQSRAETAPAHPPTAPGRSRLKIPQGPDHGVARPLTREGGTRFSPGRIANLVGMGLGMGLIWAVYQWFDALPAVPAEAPWALLGRDQGQSAEARERTAAAATPDDETLPPLGQLAYGPDFTESPLAGASGRAAYLAAGFSEVFRSIRDLEEAFNASYVPPTSCSADASPGSMASCGNHRIRARRAFIASNGRTMVPEPPSAARAAPHPGAADGASRRQERSAPPGPGTVWRQPGDAYADRGPWIPGGHWHADDLPRQAGGRADRAPVGERFGEQHGAGPGWREQQGPGDWPAWGDPEPPSDPYPAAPPQVQRLPAEEWLPRDRASALSWRDEQLLREGGIREEPARRPRDLDNPGEREGPDTGASTDPLTDWRRNWLRGE